MINSDGLFFAILINEVPIPISAKDIVKFSFSYGLLSSVPFFEIKNIDKAYLTTTIKGKFPIKLILGSSPDFVITGDFTIVSDIEMDTGEFGGLTTGFGGFKCYPTSLISNVLNYYQVDAYEVKTGETLKKVFDAFSVETNANLKPSTSDFYIYKGQENIVNFLSTLALYTTDTKGTLAYSFYYDQYNKGKVISFLDKVTQFKPTDCEGDNMIASEIESYPVMDVSLENYVRHNLLEDGLYTRVWGGSIKDAEEKAVGNINWIDQVPVIKEHLQDIIDKGEPYPSESIAVGFFNELEEQFVDTYAANISFWNKARTNISAVVVPSMVRDDLEPGSLLRVFNSSAGPNGVYVILQKSYIVARESGIYTKLWILNVKVYEQ